jgi:hypothetical protein
METGHNQGDLELQPKEIVAAAVEEIVVHKEEG